MTDFFSNLLLRSNAPTSGVILQPRLPSLFESPHGMDDLPTPPADQVRGDASAPNPFTVPVEQAGQAALPSKPAMEGKPPSKRQAGFAFESKTLMAAPEGDPGTTIALRTTENPSVQARPEPRRTILPDGRQETDNAPVLQGNGQSLQPGSRLTNGETAVRDGTESRQAGDAFSARNILQPPAESTISSSARKPVLTPHSSPAMPVSRQSGAQPEQAAQNETVVQVHIGRIEVRAVPPPAPSQPVRNSPAVKTKLSLEDYLRQREEKR